MEELKIFTPNEYQVVHKVNVDFGYKSIPVPVYLVQFDRDIPVIEVTLHNFGKTYVVPDGATVNIKFKKKDNTFVYKNADGFNEKKTAAFFTVDEQMTTIGGKQIACVEVAYNGGVIATSYIFITVSENPIQETDIESNSIYQDALTLYEKLKKSEEYYKSLLDYKMDKVGGTLDKDFILDIPSFIVAATNILRFNKLLIQNEGNNEKSRFEVDGNGNAYAKSLEVKDDINVKQGNIDVEEGNIHLKNVDGASTGHGDLIVDGKSTLNELEVNKEAEFRNKLKIINDLINVIIDDNKINLDANEVNLKHSFASADITPQNHYLDIYSYVPKTSGVVTFTIGNNTITGYRQSKSYAITNQHGELIKTSNLLQLGNSNNQHITISNTPFNSTLKIKYISSSSSKISLTIKYIDATTNETKIFTSEKNAATKENNSVYTNIFTFNEIAIKQGTTVDLSASSSSLSLVDAQFNEVIAAAPFNAIGLDKDGNIIIDSSKGINTLIKLIGNAVLNGKQIATIDDIAQRVAALVNSSPETLNTLDELAKALGNDPNFATTITNALGKKADKTAIPTKVNQLQEDINHQTVTQTQKDLWTHKKADLDTEGKILKEQLPDAAFSAADEPDKNGDYHTDLDAKQRILMGVPFDREEKNINANNGMQLVAIETSILTSLTADEPRFNALFNPLRKVLPKDETTITFSILGISRDLKDRITDFEIEFTPGIDEEINTAVNSIVGTEIYFKSLFDDIFTDLKFNNLAQIGDTFSLILKRQSNKNSAYYFESKGIPDEYNAITASQASSSIYAFGNQRIKATYDGIEIFAPTKFELTAQENRLERKEVRVAKFTSTSALFNFLEKISMQINGSKVLEFNATKLILNCLKQIIFRTTGNAGFELNGDKVKFTGKTFTYNDKEVATLDDITQRITTLINNSPAALDTLNELANALGNDPNFATTITNALGKKADKTEMLALGETASTAYAGDKGKENADAIATLQSDKLDKLNPFPGNYGVYGHFPNTAEARLLAATIGAGGTTLLLRDGFGKSRISTPNDTDDPTSIINVEYFKNNRSPIIKTTHDNLKTLKANAELIPGMQYRITDYTCTTTQSETRSAGHIFDIIVTADNEDTLNENARACLHEGDTYFANSKLEAWELKYSLDNDATRFAWADPTNGKGVIYWMKDEFNNECPYDFKNIQFKRYACTLKVEYECFDDSIFGLYSYFGTTLYVPEIFTMNNTDSIWVYTFHDAVNNVDGTVVDNNIVDNYAEVRRVYNNVIKEYVVSYIVDDNTKVYSVSQLNDIVFYTKIYDDESTNHPIHSNLFGDNCHTMTFSKKCDSNTFGNDCYSNIFGNDCNFNTFGDGCYFNTFGNDCDSNTFGNGCYSNIFDNNCYSNTFDNNCVSNSLGSYCHFNTFGSNCGRNTFDPECGYNIFGNNCFYNTLKGGNISNNIFDCGVVYVFLTSSSIGAYDNEIQNIHIHQGVKGTSDAKKVINVERNAVAQIDVVAAGNKTIEV